MTGEIIIGIADIKAGTSGQKLTTIGLGSCIGVVIFDKRRPYAVLGHFMLPDSTNARRSQQIKIAKYGDTCIDQMIKDIVKMGAVKTSLSAKAAGGASMFKRSGSGSNVMDISTRNISSMKENLKKHRIPLVADDVGGNRGRTITYDVDSQKLTIKVVDPSMQGKEKYRRSTI
ncbi:MAG: chemotaxis protein CheD [Candidatus Thermoplasmatota archaeon]|nr:chemotaxis protein CheD [Candidatus Thermoplasmatota archaeon]